MNVMEKSLDKKLARILADPSCADFILADAKDADMAAGLAAPGKSPEHHAGEATFRSLQEYRDLIRQNVQQGLVDIMLMSASTNEVLTIKERLFDNSHITPAIRANDTTDIWLAQGSVYSSQPALPFRTATIDHAMCGKVQCEPAERTLGANLGLYSLTFNNDTQLDHRTLEAYNAFRLEAEQKGYCHFLEVFDPNAPRSAIADLGRFISDNIVRLLAGVTQKGRPLFLKIAYHGPQAMEQLCAYDRHLVVGILGGSSGTTLDAFHQLWEAKKYGARVALYGRMINNAEHQLTFIQHLRWLADGDLDDPAEAVRSYHGALQKLGVRPYRELKDDLQSTLRASSYAGGGKPTAATAATAPATTGPPIGATTSILNNADTGADDPDFDAMTSAEKVQWNLRRWRDVLG